MCAPSYFFLFAERERERHRQTGYKKVGQRLEIKQNSKINIAGARVHVSPQRPVLVALSRAAVGGKARVEKKLNEPSARAARSLPRRSYSSTTRCSSTFVQPMSARLARSGAPICSRARRRHPFSVKSARSRGVERERKSDALIAAKSLQSEGGDS